MTNALYSMADAFQVASGQPKDAADMRHREQFPAVPARMSGDAKSSQPAWPLRFALPKYLILDHGLFSALQSSRIKLYLVGNESVTPPIGGIKYGREPDAYQE